MKLNGDHRNHQFQVAERMDGELGEERRLVEACG
jgi:hypothetical protein